MLKKDEKDNIIQFLRDTIKNVKERVSYIGGYHYHEHGCSYYDPEECAEIADMCDKALIETTF